MTDDEQLAGITAATAAKDRQDGIACIQHKAGVTPDMAADIWDALNKPGGALLAVCYMPGEKLRALWGLIHMGKTAGKV